MRRLIGLIVIAWFGFLSVFAQCAAENEAIQPGEELVYELKFNWKFIWVKAGKAYMDVQATTYKNKPAYNCSLLTVTNSTVDMFFKMRDTLTCITSQQLEPMYFKKAAEEGSRYTIDEVRFSYPNGQVQVSQVRKRSDRSPVFCSERRSECVFDMLSILLRARSFDVNDYKVGDKILFPMATGTRIEEQTLIYRGKEVFKAEDDTRYRCLVFSLVEYDKKKREKEVITFFITDDENHLPVRLDLYLNFGSAKAFLKSVKGNRHPLTSILKEED